MSWQRWLYDRAYRSGRSARWDSGITPPEVVAEIEGEQPLTPGRALDLGCGTGTNALYLSKHGWQVVGVDFSPLAIAAARQKLAGTKRVTFVQGDVTRLSQLGVDGPFDLVLDPVDGSTNASRGLPWFATSLCAVARNPCRRVTSSWSFSIPGSLNSMTAPHAVHTR